MKLGKLFNVTGSKIITRQLKIVFMVAFSFSDYSALAQIDFDTPFILSRQKQYEPDPLKFIYFEKGKLTDNERSILKENPIYQPSYLYSEPYFSRIRVFRYIDLQENLFLSTTPNTKWIKKGQFTESLAGYEMQIHAPHYTRCFRGVPLSYITQDTFPDSYEKQLLPYFIEDLEKYRDKEKKDAPGFYFAKEIYEPDSFKAIPFLQLLKSMLSTGLVSMYSKADFTEEIGIEKIEGIFKSNIIALRVKEDYYFNRIKGKMDSKIIGMGLVGINNKPGDELCWINYAEMRPALLNQCGVYENTFINYEFIFDQHLPTFRLEKIERIGSYSNQVMDDDSDKMVWLDPYFLLKLVDENDLIAKKGKIQITMVNVEDMHNTNIYYTDETAIGMESFYKSGKLYFRGSLDNNNCNGTFTFFYSDGKPKATLQYKGGKLAGDQVLYWPNGNIYCSYTVKKEEISSLKRFYEEGELMEEGKFKNGVIDGIWQYTLKVPDLLLEKIMKGELFPDEPGFNIINKSFEYKINYFPKYTNDCKRMEKKYCLDKKVEN